MFEATYVVKFDDAEIGYNGFSVSSNATTCKTAESFVKAFLKTYEGNGIESVKVLELRKVDSIKDFTEKCNTTIIEG